MTIRLVALGLVACGIVVAVTLPVTPPVTQAEFGAVMCARAGTGAVCPPD